MSVERKERKERLKGSLEAGVWDRLLLLLIHHTDLDMAFRLFNFFSERPLNRGLDRVKIEASVFPYSGLNRTDKHLNTNNSPMAIVRIV